MSAYLPIGELAGCVFPYDCRDRNFLVLRAYLDDSGTHDHSNVIVMAGVIATDRAWERLELTWRELLTKYGIRKSFHMNKLMHRSWKSDFRGWSDCKVGRALTDFRRAIIETKGRLLATAVPRQVWNSARAKTPELQGFADPIDFLQVVAMRKALETQRKETFPHIFGRERTALVFDLRLQNFITWNRFASQMARRNQHFAGYTFGKTEEVLPLQAADMVAYEAHGYLRDRLRHGKRTPFTPNFKRLDAALPNGDMGIFDERQLIAYAKENVRFGRRPT